MLHAIGSFLGKDGVVISCGFSRRHTVAGAGLLPRAARLAAGLCAIQRTTWALRPLPGVNIVSNYIYTRFPRPLSLESLLQLKSADQRVTIATTIQDELPL